MLSYLIINCFHWVGFHFINFLLENGEKVTGIDQLDSEKKEHLSMFFGRNNSFQFIEEESQIAENYNMVIIIGGTSNHSISANKTVRIVFNEKVDREEKVIDIQAPILFGEWMPMNDEGVSHRGKMLPFSSKTFLTEAVYIKDFVQTIIQILNASAISHSIITCSEKSSHLEDKTLANYVFIRDNRPIKEKINELILHYSRFKQFYIE